MTHPPPPLALPTPKTTGQEQPPRGLAPRAVSPSMTRPPSSPSQLQTTGHKQYCMYIPKLQQDKGSRRVALRPELTPSLARLVLSKQKVLTLPAKWFAIGQCWRYERMTRGRRCGARCMGLCCYVLFLGYVVILCACGLVCVGFCARACARAGHLARGVGADGVWRRLRGGADAASMPNAMPRRREHYQWNMDIVGVPGVEASGLHACVCICVCVCARGVTFVIRHMCVCFKSRGTGCLCTRCGG